MKSRLAARVHGARAGYTIMEVMIVLAVTGAIFLSAALMLGGRQGVAEVTQAVRDFESKLQTISSDVQTGFYPNGYSCTVPGTGQPSVGGAVDVDLYSGANRECIAIGKVLAIREDDASIMTLVGRHYRSDPPAFTDVSNITEAQPIVVEQATGVSPSSVSVTEFYEYRYALRVTKIVSVASGTTYGAIALVTELANSTAAGSPVTGSRATRVYSVNNSSIGDSLADVAARVNAPGSLILESSGVFVCMIGANGTPAVVEIGSTSDNSSTVVKIGDAVGTACD